MISSGKVVGMSYTLTDTDGNLLDQADAKDLFYYLHGHGNIVPGLEKGLEGLDVGAKEKITVLPEEAYGEVRSDLVVTVSRAQFPPGTDIQAGQEFMADVGGGRKMPFLVKDVEGDEITLDGNHPLAGQTLNFDIEIFEIRDATKEEMEHGHAHGAGGHHHH